MCAVGVWLAVAILEREAPIPDEVDRPLPERTVAPPDTPAVPPPITGAAAEDVVDRVAQMRVAVRRYEDECAGQLQPAAGEGTAAIVADCVRRLAAAVDALVASDTIGHLDLEQRLGTFRDRLAELEALPPGSARAAQTRAVLTSAAELIITIRDRRFTESVEVDGAQQALRDAAGGIREDRTLAAQQDRVREFFLRAGELLAAMARPGLPGPGAVEPAESADGTEP